MRESARSRSGAGLGPTPLSVELAAGGFRVALARQEDRLVIAVDDTRELHQPAQPSDYLLMREELGIVRRDAGFRADAGIRGPSRVCYGLMSVRWHLSPMRPRPPKPARIT